jgi:uncharacterized membrane protein (UPF0127 family)
MYFWRCSLMKLVKVVNETRGAVIGDRVEVANTSMRRLFGLLGRRSLNAGQGLWIKPSSGVHTMGMMFPIDVVGLDRKGTVLKVWKDLVPFRVTSVSLKMHSVIELRAGQIAESGTHVGDTLKMVEL